MSEDALDLLRDDVLETALEMERAGLTEGTAGNVSARTEDGRVVLTPTGLPYSQMAPADLVVTDLEGELLEGHRAPTTEIDLHLACLRRHTEIRAVVHTHAVHASMFAVAGRPIPCVLEEFEYYVGGDVLVGDGGKRLGERGRFGCPRRRRRGCRRLARRCCRSCYLGDLGAVSAALA